MKRLGLVILVTLFSGSAIADRPGVLDDNDRRGPDSTITVSVNGLACSMSGGAGTFAARSWSWGATNSVSFGSGAGTGKAMVGNLSVKKAFDACSPVLLGAVTQGRHFANLTLSQRDSNGNVVATVALNDVFVVSWNVGSSIRESVPDETVAFIFRRVCLSSSGNQTCYDTVTQAAN